MGRTACTEPQCLYKGALYLFITSNSMSNEWLGQEKVWLITMGEKSSHFGQRFVMPGNQSRHYGRERTAVHIRNWKTGHAVPTSRSVDRPLRAHGGKEPITHCLKAVQKG